MANVWMPVFYFFNLRISENKFLKFEVSASYDEQYPDSINGNLSMFPLVKGGVLCKTFIDLYDISYALMALSNILNKKVKESLVINRKDKKVYIKNEGNLYRLYFTSPNSNLTFDLSNFELFNLYNIFEMLKCSYGTFLMMAYSSAMRYKFSQIEKKNVSDNNKNYEIRDKENPIDIGNMLNSPIKNNDFAVMDDMYKNLNSDKIDDILSTKSVKSNKEKITDKHIYESDKIYKEIDNDILNDVFDENDMVNEKKISMEMESGDDPITNKIFMKLKENI